MAMDDAPGTEDILAVQRVLSGDESAFASLVERHAGDLRRFCALRLGSREDAEDAVQEVFLRAFKALPSFKLGLSFRAWLFAIAANRIKTRYASRGREKDLRAKAESEYAVLADSGRADAEKEAIEALEAWAARSAISRLGPANRPVAELYYVAGLGVEEIGQALGLGAEAVKSRLFRARKEIMKKAAADATETDVEG